MPGRTRLRVWSMDLQRWKSVHCLNDKVAANLALLRSYGFNCDVG